MNGFVGHGWFGVSFHLRRIEDASVPSVYRSFPHMRTSAFGSSGSRPPQWGLSRLSFKGIFFLIVFFFLPYTRVPRAATSAIKPLAGCHAAISTSKITVNNMVPRHSNSDSKV